MPARQQIGPEWILKVTCPQLDERERARLLECAQRVWPRLRGLTRRAFAFQAKDEDRDCVAVEAFEAVLVLSAKTISEASRQILNLEAYLFAAFRYELARRALEEKKLRNTLEFLPPDELDVIRDQGAHSTQFSVERRLQVEEIACLMDAWTREVWSALLYGESWTEIGALTGMTRGQARQKFRYQIGKIKARLRYSRT
jgi:hypothetical protein